MAFWNLTPITTNGNDTKTWGFWWYRDGHASIRISTDPGSIRTAPGGVRTVSGRLRAASGRLLIGAHQCCESVPYSSHTKTYLPWRNQHVTRNKHHGQWHTENPTYMHNTFLAKSYLAVTFPTKLSWRLPHGFFLYQRQQISAVWWLCYANNAHVARNKHVSKRSTYMHSTLRFTLVVSGLVHKYVSEPQKKAQQHIL